MATDETIEKKESVILWGPTSSGKTSLFHSFIKQVTCINSRSKDFSYGVKNWQTNYSYSIRDMEKKPEATSWKVIDELLVVKREPIISDQQHKQNSCFEYSLHLQDYMGSYAIHAAQNRPNTVLNAPNIFIVLDCALIDKPPNEDEEGSYSLDNYVYDIADLRERLEANEKFQNINVAVCVSKIDIFASNVLVNQDGVIRTDPHTFIEKNFKKAILDEINRFAKNRKFTLQMFLTSAVGFVWNERHQKEANYNSGNGWVKDLRNWEPVGVTDPFFWIFNQIEEDHWKNELSNSSKSWSRLKNVEPFKPINWPINLRPDIKENENH